MKKCKKILALLLVLAMTLSLAACGKDKNETNSTPTPGQSGDITPVVGENAKAKTYTFHDYASSLGSVWNPHTWETNSEDLILSYISTPLVNLQIANSEEGLYQWIYEMATSVEDVTKDHKDDLKKYEVLLPVGKTVDDVEDGYVFEIKLREGAMWEDGTKINADTYIYSMKALLDPKMKNYRSNNYWSGESAVAGGKAYYYAGETTLLENYDGAKIDFASLEDLKKGDDGVYTTPDGGKVYIALGKELTWLQGDALKDYVEAYGDTYFGTATWEQLVALMDAETGLVPLTDDSYKLFVPVTTTVADWGETEDDVPAYFYYEKTFGAANFDNVGLYKVDEYTIRYVNESHIDRNYFMTSLTSNWLVNETLYEKLKKEEDGVVTTTYGTSLDTTISYGPYKMSSLQKDKQVVFVQNEKWFGYTKNADGSLTAMTSKEGFQVDGKDTQQYQATSIVIDVLDDNAAKQAFLKGNLSIWYPTAEELVNYSTSDQLYKRDETYTMRFFFNTNLDALKAMDANKGNQNSVVLSNENFRKAMSLAFNRTEFVKATPGYKPACFILNGLYYYNVYDDPSSIYRSSDEAMQAICNLYGVEYGEGKAYATLEDAYKSINGYNLTVAKELMTKACDELVAAGLYNKGDDIKIRIGWAKGALESADQAQVALVNAQINAALEGTGFGKITFEAVGNIENRYKDVPAGEYAMGYGAWGGAAFYPFTMFQVYCDPDYVSIHEGACWNPATETLTINVNGEDDTMTWQKWSSTMSGNGKYASADFATKLGILAAMEENYLKKYYCIPLCCTTACEMLSFQLQYYTDEYNIMYDFGGLRLMQFHYDDEAWTKAVADQGGILSYE
ncbi:MAG: hypothetical protein IKX54_00185 [Lachnospiraceae bacterium]|nr:hypothetical protein [Lachnospiraceae bacterium]